MQRSSWINGTSGRYLWHNFWLTNYYVEKLGQTRAILLLGNEVSGEIMQNTTDWYWKAQKQHHYTFIQNKGRNQVKSQARIICRQVSWNEEYCFQYCIYRALATVHELLSLSREHQSKEHLSLVFHNLAGTLHQEIWTN